MPSEDSELMKPYACIKCGGFINSSPLSHPDNKKIWAWQYRCCDQTVTISHSGTTIESPHE